MTSKKIRTVKRAGSQREVNPSPSRIGGKARKVTSLSPSVVLSIGGSDSSSGAGVQADLKTFFAHKVYGLTAVTAVVAEVPGRVSEIFPVDLKTLEAQIELSLKAYPVAAIKTGMLFSAKAIELVGRIYDKQRSQKRLLPLIVDPIICSTAGKKLLQDDGLGAYQKYLIPKASLVTPNLDEAEQLLGRTIKKTANGILKSAVDLVETYQVPFLVKGGHGTGNSISHAFAHPNGINLLFLMPRVENITTHGTGCALSAAIAAQLALGEYMLDAVRYANNYVWNAVAHSFIWKSSNGGKNGKNGKAPKTQYIHALNHRVEFADLKD